MNKVKINSGLASVLVLVSLFAGWQTLLLVVLFILLFCELDDTIKGMIIKVVSFYAALALFSTLWGLLTDVFPLAVNSFDKFIEIIEGYIDEPIDLSKVHAYLFDPINSIISIADSIVQYLIVLVKFMFIISVLANKVMKENFITKFINKYVDKVVDFVNGIELGKVDINNPKAPSTPSRPQMVPTSKANEGVSLGTMPEVKPAEPEVKPEVIEQKLEEPKPALEVPPVVPTPPVEEANNTDNN